MVFSSETPALKQTNSLILPHLNLVFRCSLNSVGPGIELPEVVLAQGVVRDIVGRCLTSRTGIPAQLHAMSLGKQKGRGNFLSLGRLPG